MELTDEVLAVVVTHAMITRNGVPLSGIDLGSIRLTVRQLRELLNTLEPLAPPLTTEVN